MEQLIQLLVYVLFFGVISYGAWWVCIKFQAPQPVLWIVGVILLIFLLYFLSGQLGGGHFQFRR